MPHKNEKLGCLQLAYIPLSLHFTAVGVSFLYLCPNEKFLLVILMYLLGKIHITWLKPIAPALCSLSMAPCSGHLSTSHRLSQRSLSFRTAYPSSPTLTQAKDCLLLAGVHQGLLETQALVKEEGTPHDLCLGAVLQICLLLPFSSLWMTMRLY